MTKYIVKKEFVHANGVHYVAGDTLDTTNWREGYHDLFNKTLETKSFIEEVEEDTRWQPKHGDTVFYIDIEYGLRQPFEINQAKMSKDEVELFSNDDAVYRTPETAEKVAEALKLFFNWLHNPEASNLLILEYTPDITLSQLAKKMDAAREAVLADDKRGSDE